MNNSKKFSLKQILNDSNLIRDIKTVVSFLLAYVIAVVSNGLIEGFSPAALISIAVSLGAFGTFFAIKIVTNEFTDRGMFDEEETNEELKKRLADIKKYSADINSTIAYDVLVIYNKEKFAYLQKAKYNDLKDKYELELKRLDSLLEHAKITKKLKWFNRLNKWYVSRLSSRKRNMTKKLAKLSPNDIFVRYTSVTLQQLRVASVDEKDARFNESERFNITPQKKIRKKMAITSFVKTFFFVGFQGAAIATIASWATFFIFLALMTLTLAVTAVSSYVNTRRYAQFNYIPILDEKIEKLKWLISETAKVKPIEPNLVENQQKLQF